MRAATILRVTGIVFAVGINAANGWAQSVPSSSDPRIIAWTDPLKGFGSYPKYRYQFQVGNVEPAITSIGEPGWYDSRISQHTVSKQADPANGSKRAFRHRIVKGMTYRQDSGYQSARASTLGSWNGSSVLKDGQPFWAAYAFYVGPDHPFNGTGGDLGIMSLGHSVSSKNTQSMGALFLQRNGTMRFLISSNSVLNGGNSTYKGTSFTKSIQKGTWHYIIIQCKFEWDKAKGPYTRVWHAVGNGAPVQWVNSNIPNSFRESAGYHPWKYGIYAWDITSGSNGIWSTRPASSSRTTYTKGMKIFADKPGSPTLNVNSLLALLRSM